jgi:hypothetical protein
MKAGPVHRDGYQFLVRKRKENGSHLKESREKKKERRRLTLSCCVTVSCWLRGETLGVPVGDLICPSRANELCVVSHAYLLNGNPVPCNANPQINLTPLILPSSMQIRIFTRSFIQKREGRTLELDSEEE